MKKLLLALTLITVYLNGFVQTGTLDPNFGNGGIVRTDFGSSGNMYADYGREILAHADGSFYIVFEIGEQTFVAHYLQSGILDMTYGEKGFSVPAYLRDPHAVMQADGKIVAGG